MEVICNCSYLLPEENQHTSRAAKSPEVDTQITLFSKVHFMRSKSLVHSISKAIILLQKCN